MSIYTIHDAAEIKDSVQEEHVVDGVGTASVQLRALWANKNAIVSDILSNRRLWPHASGNEGPRAHTCTVVPDGSCEGISATGQCINYPIANITVQYSTNVEEDLISETLEPNVSFITQDYKKFRWGSPTGKPLQEGEAPGKQIRGAKLTRTLYQVEPPLPVTLLTLMGHVNETLYASDLIGLDFEPETLLYSPPTMSRVITTNETKGWDITLKFIYQQWGWNKFWNGEDEEWQRIYLAKGASLGSGSVAGSQSGAYYNYPLGDFSDFLF